MSEHLPHRQEQERQPHNPEAEKLSREKLEKLLEKAEKAPDTDDKTIEKLRETVEHEAKTKEKAETHVQRHETTPSRIDKSVKKQAYQKTIKDVQHKLPRGQRAFSKFIHQPTVEKISEVGSKTVARPSALLSSGFFALIGTTLLVWMSRHYGFAYNYFMFVVFLIGGFILGLILEFLWRGLRKATGK